MLKIKFLIIFLLFKDVLREKQNHIEQLLIERDLDRHDAENQVLMYQKDISQVGIYLIVSFIE